MDVDRAAECLDASGLLCLAPDSWWLHLIRMLPAKERLALFQVSRQLASRLVQCAAKVGLHLLDRNHLQLAASESDARCNVITGLLRACCSFTVKADIQHADHMPFPMSLSNHITSLDISLCEQARPATAWLDWQALHNLKELEYSNTQSSCQDVSGLCEALEAAQLPRLQKASFQLGPDDPPNTLLERLARALGPQLRQLATNRGSLLAFLPHFTVLRAVHLFDCLLSPVQVQALCEQPNLDTVQMGYGFKVQGDHSQRRCSWGVLQLDDYIWDMLPVLPLAGVQHVRAVRGVLGLQDLERQVIRAVLPQHSHKFVCQPVQLPGYAGYTDLPIFTMSGPCEEMIPLLPQIQTACRLRLQREPRHAGVLQAMWRALPACVEVVALEDFRKFLDWAHVWQDFPQHVHRLEVICCKVDVSDLCKLVRTAPKHIAAMELMPWPRTQYAVWEAAGLHEYVSGQVAVHIRHPHRLS